MISRAGNTKVFQGVHVDDIAQETTNSKESCIESLCAAGDAPTSRLIADGFSMSSKSVVLSSCKGINKGLINFFKPRGIIIKAQQVSPHLGYSRTSDPRRTFSVIKERFARGTLRTRKIHAITKASHKTKSLFTTGVLPQSIIGTTLLGLTESLGKQIVTMALSCCKQLGLGAEPTPTLLLHYDHIPSIDLIF